MANGIEFPGWVLGAACDFSARVRGEWTGAAERRTLGACSTRARAARCRGRGLPGCRDLLELVALPGGRARPPGHSAEAGDRRGRTQAPTRAHRTRSPPGVRRDRDALPPDRRIELPDRLCRRRRYRAGIGVRQSVGATDAGRRIIPGSRWSEEVCGTNALGTAIVTGQPIIVHGPEHFYSCYGQVCCTAAPIRGAAGELVGMLDASSDCVSRQSHTLALVKMAATHIENGFFAHQMQAQVILAIHPRAEFLGTISAGMIAIDGTGLISAVNPRAASILHGSVRGTRLALRRDLQRAVSKDCSSACTSTSRPSSATRWGACTRSPGSIAA